MRGLACGFAVLALLSGCSSAPVLDCPPPVVLTEAVEVACPVLEPRRPPPELLTALPGYTPVLAPVGDYCLSWPDLEDLIEAIAARTDRIRAWEAWATGR